MSEMPSDVSVELKQRSLLVVQSSRNVAVEFARGNSWIAAALRSWDFEIGIPVKRCGDSLSLFKVVSVLSRYCGSLVARMAAIFHQEGGLYLSCVSVRGDSK